MNKSIDLYWSFDDLQAAHGDLLERYDQLGDAAENSAEFWTEVEEFLESAQATGALFHESGERMERRATQSILDYWTNTLHRADRPAPLARLAPFDKELAPTLPDEPRPYQGLSAFDESRHEFFFGRETLVDEMVEKLRKGERLLIVLGASGSGKSSVVRAGLLQALKTGALPGSEGWRQVTMVPGADAMANLQRALQRAALDRAGPMPATDSDSVPTANSAQHAQDTPAEALTATSEEPIVLVVDQFEELFTLCKDRETYKGFESQLLRLVDEPHPRHIVIVTMRNDFTENLPLLPQLHGRLEAARVNVEALGIEELRDAILKPAANVNLKFDPDVVVDLVEKILGQRAGLPLLQFALLQLWTERDKNRVTEAVYRKVGDPLEALGRSADQFFDSLIREDQKAVERIFLQIVQMEEREETSKRVPLQQVLERAKVKERTESMVHRLVCEAGLVKLTGTTADICSERFGFKAGKLSALAEEESKRGNVLQVEVAHEALVRNWDALDKWVEEERLQLATRRLHDGKAAEWVRLGRKSAGLLDEVELLEVERWLRTSVAAEVGYDPDLLDLVDASQTAIDMAKREKAEAAKRRRLRARWLAVVSAVALVLLIIASVLAGLSIRSLAEARRSTTALRLAVAAIRNLEIDPELGLLLTYYAAWETYQPDRAVVLEAEDALHQALQVLLPEWTATGHTGVVNDVAFNAEGTRLATASADGTVKVWDTISNSNVLTLTGHTSFVNSVAFSPSGARLATASADRTAKVWDTISGTNVLTLIGHTGIVNDVAFDAKGTRLATASADGTVRVWDAISGTNVLTLTGHTSYVYNVAFSPDGTRLASASADRTAKVWDANTGEEMLTLTGHVGAILDIAFSPDGTRLATASQDKTARVWDSETGKPMPILVDHNDAVNGVAFSPDGTRLATASADKTARVLVFASGEELEELYALGGHSRAVRQIAFHPDGIHLATASADMTAKVWDLRSEEPRILGGHTSSSYGVAFDASGERLATASADKTAKIWDVGTGGVLLTLTGHTGAVNDVAFSPDGKWLGTASADGTAKVWDSGTGQEVLTLKGRPGAVNAVAFSPDGKWLATASADGTAKVWDSGTGQEVLTLTGHTAAVNDVAFSPDGKWLATASADGRAMVRDGQSGEILLILSGHNDAVLDIAFSPDGHHLATASADGAVKVWDGETGRNLLSLVGQSGAVSGIAYSLGGERLITGSVDGTVTLWDASSGLELFSLAGHSGEVNATAFSADGKHLATASADSTAHVYIMDVVQLIELTRQRTTRELTDAECKTYWPGEEGCPPPVKAAR